MISLRVLRIEDASLTEEYDKATNLSSHELVDSSDTIEAYAYMATRPQSDLVSWTTRD